MSKTWIFLSSLGGTAAAVGGYFAYSYWNPDAIAKRKQELQIKKFEEAVKDYETRQDKKLVHDYLKKEVCEKEIEKPEQATEWCKKINSTDSVKDLIQGLTDVNDRKKPYEEMVAEIGNRVPLKDNLFSQPQIS